MVDDHFDSQGIVDVHEEGIDGIMALGLDGGDVHRWNGSQERSVVGIFAAYGIGIIKVPSILRLSKSIILSTSIKSPI